MITIAFFTSNFWLSRVIRILLKSPTSHVALGLELDGKKVFVHAISGGIKIEDRDVVLSYDRLVEEYEILPDISKEVPAALAHVGDKYNALELMGYVWILFLRFFKIRTKNPFARHGAEVCSEFVTECDPEGKIEEFINLEPSEVTPRDLLDICRSGKSFLKL